MPLIVGKHIEKKPEVKDNKPVPPSPVEYKWNTEERRMVRVNGPVETAPVVPVEKSSTYHHQVEGDLHKLINKKSDYLKDMLDFDSNK